PLPHLLSALLAHPAEATHLAKEVVPLSVLKKSTTGVVFGSVRPPIEVTCQIDIEVDRARDLHP
ncbi:MAG TPA: hypothetical protein VHW24_01130, partial [Bryobacteraceae bacterium]|nr:hypothetical protein [Bryobacteraceae bacterium]